jgi:GTPase involved in cell partitioning and DNA repair
LTRLKELSIDFLFNNKVIHSKLGNPMNIHELLHLTTINSLNNIRQECKSLVRRIEDKDEWIICENDSIALKEAKESEELVNLIIGYKRYQNEQNAILKKKAALQEQLNELKESQKTPAERIAEIEAQIAQL